MKDKLKSFLWQRYSREEFPALLSLMEKWEADTPLRGVSVLDATPVFFNTGLKYLALLSAGAELTVSAAPGIPCDPEAVKFFRECGINVVTDMCFDRSFDCICDCAGKHCHIPSKYGIVELTGSGAHVYRNWNAPVFLADGGKVKVLETGLGTGNGLLRAMLELNTGSPEGRDILIFGGGKVGCGVALALDGAGAKCHVVDIPERVRCRSSKLDIIPINDEEAIKDAISKAWAIVTATGVKDAVANFSAELTSSKAFLMNIGVEDEFGSEVPEERVMNKKMPLNFILDEPTLLRYIDPTMALSNIGVVELLSGRCANGLNIPSQEIETELLREVAKGAAASDIPKLEEFYYG